MIDLVLHAADEATALAWFTARQLYGVDEVRDAEGEITQERIPPTDFQYVKYGSGVVYSTPPTFDTDGNETAAGTLISGQFFACRFPTSLFISQYVQDNSTGNEIVTGLRGLALDSITLVRPQDFDAYLDASGQPKHTWLGGAEYADPALVAQGFPVFRRIFGDKFGAKFA